MAPLGHADLTKMEKLRESENKNQNESKKQNENKTKNLFLFSFSFLLLFLFCSVVFIFKFYYGTFRPPYCCPSKGIFLSYFKSSTKRLLILFKVPVHFNKSLCTIQIHASFYTLNERCRFLTQ